MVSEDLDNRLFSGDKVVIVDWLEEYAPDDDGKPETPPRPEAPKKKKEKKKAKTPYK